MEKTLKSKNDHIKYQIVDINICLDWTNCIQESSSWWAAHSTERFKRPLDFHSALEELHPAHLAEEMPGIKALEHGEFDLEEGSCFGVTETRELRPVHLVEDPERTGFTGIVHIMPTTNRF